MNLENNKTKMKLNKSKNFIGRFNLCDREVTTNKYPETSVSLNISC